MILLFSLLAVWCLWLITAAAGRAAEDASRGIPEGQRGGVSFFPALPLVPMLSWGVAWLIDRVARPWGTIIIGVPHAVFATFLAVTLVRDERRLRKIDHPE